eukprot:COSAG06_NODE_367_length_16758_cov_27.111651_5_plen_215_part_00
MTCAAAASPRPGAQGTRRCAGRRRGCLQATAADPARAVNLTSATGEYDLGARRARAHARALGTRPRCGRARLHAHRPGPGQPRSAPRAVWPRAQTRTGWLVASPASPAAAPPPLLLLQTGTVYRCWLLPLPAAVTDCALRRLCRLTAASSQASGSVPATDTSSWPCSSGSGRTSGTTPATLPASSQVVQHDTRTCLPCESCGLSCTLLRALVDP